MVVMIRFTVTETMAETVIDSESTTSGEGFSVGDRDDFVIHDHGGIRLTQPGW